MTASIPYLMRQMRQYLRLFRRALGPALGLGLGQHALDLVACDHAPRVDVLEGQHGRGRLEELAKDNTLCCYEVSLAVLQVFELVDVLLWLQQQELMRVCLSSLLLK